MITDKTFHSRIEKFWPSNIKSQITVEEILYYRHKIKRLLKQRDACLIAHYYVDAEIQKLAEETGGILGDSLTMAYFGKKHKAQTLVVAGVRFMGESAKILSPQKTVIMPTLRAECSLDISCQEQEFKEFIEKYPNRTIVVYVNTSARIKALADWTVTSSNALSICSYLDSKGQKILWAPDKYLGRWIRQQTSADMINYNGSCVVHEEFKAKALYGLKTEYPSAAILVHPESPQEVIEMADVIGSTSHLLKASFELPNKIFIVATEVGIFYKMKELSPEKIFIEAPTAGKGATCKSCAHCPWMSMNNLKNLAEVLEGKNNEILLPDSIIAKAILPLTRMVNFKEHYT